MPVRQSLANTRPNSPVIMLKNGAGQVYLPEYGIDEIQRINPVQGYQLLSKRNGQFQITGTPLDPTLPVNVGKPDSNSIFGPGGWGIFSPGGWGVSPDVIDPSMRLLLSGLFKCMPTRRMEGILPGDWGLIGFLPNQPVPVEEALAGLADKIWAMKNSSGQLWIPDMGINEIGMMRPGEAYWVCVGDTGSFEFPAGRLGKRAFASDSVYYSSVFYTGENATVIIPAAIHPCDAAGEELQTGDEIAVFNTGGVCCGSEVWNESNAALTVWGDNPMTDETDGMLSGDTLIFRIYDKSRGVEMQALAEFESPGQPVYAANSLSVLTESAGGAPVGVGQNAELPDGFRCYANYPNPFNPETVIQYDLARSSKVSLAIYNLLGQHVRTLVSGPMPAGSHRIVWDSRNQFGRRVASGVYLYRITVKETSGGKICLDETHKMLHIR
ncbi:MAG: FlgD immunoglobulin-like domain containing protein [candidate division KSB1 bacterium]|nr:FlgD immunoglobulin-like domain containing protein [candidate division KSB1 bacterium]